MKRFRRAPRPVPVYSHIDVLLASSTAPMPEEKGSYYLTRMHLALAALERDERPTPEDWRALSDAVNLMKTMLRTGMVQDPDGTHQACVGAMAGAGERYLRGERMGLDGPGMRALRGLLEDFGELLATVPHREMLKVWIATDHDVRQVLSGKTRPGDVVISV